MEFTRTITSLLICSLLTFTFSSCQKSDQEEDDPKDEEEINTFTDSRDSKQYKWVKIGTQTWMAENLAYLPSVNSPSDESSSDPRYYVEAYAGTNVADARATDNYKVYGVLYNWPAASAACPTGWHLPSDDEWKVLEIYLGMSQSEADEIGGLDRGTDEGSKLAGNSSLWDPGLLKSNASFGSSGFQALPGGFLYTGSFSGTGRYGKWWSSTLYYSRVIDRALYYSNAHSGRGDESHKEYGYSIRCIKD
ncbi:MAG: hypothetical protein GX622_09320 [Bacteroidales bacterium]|nr:hypothetical protein [Bacteroidales bacterium]